VIRKELEAIAAEYPDRFKVWYTLDRPGSGKASVFWCYPFSIFFKFSQRYCKTWCMQSADSAGSIAAGAHIQTNTLSFSRYYDIFSERSLKVKDCFSNRQIKHSCYNIGKKWLPTPLFIHRIPSTTISLLGRSNLVLQKLLKI
jgi:hypothetical protein